MRLPPILKALLLQGIALGLMAIALRISGFSMPIGIAAVGCGLIAALLTLLAGMPRWWQPVQALFIPAMFALLLLDLPSWVYLALFLLLATVYWSTYRTQVPLYLSSSKVEQALADLLPEQTGFTFIDIGAGLGGVICRLSTSRSDGRFTGIENAPLPFILAWLRMRGQKNCCMQRGDFWQHSLQGYDVVYAYLSPVPMAKLWDKVQREMKPGSLFVSNTFEVPGHTPDRTVELQDFHRSRLLIWKIS